MYESGDIVKIPVLCKEQFDERYEKLLVKFCSLYSTPFDVIVRVPGRVNLIGEHIDYCGFSVLPMAIDQDIVLAFKSNSSSLTKLSNYDDQYPSSVHSLDNLQIQWPPLWYHYVLSAFKGIIEEYKANLPGFDILVWGNIPPSSGLSSSSALVCSSIIAALWVFDKSKLDKYKVATLAASSEKLVGVQGGAMDQSIEMLAEKGFAKLIKFDPLQAIDVCLPNGISFFVSSTGITLNKAATEQYNTRVFETKIASLFLAKSLCILKESGDFSITDITKIKNLVGNNLKNMPEVVKKTFIAGKMYTIEDVLMELSLDNIDKLETLLCNGNENTIKKFRIVLDQNIKFKLYERALHVVEEARRVEEFVEICKSEKPSEEKVKEIGRLMNASHESCSKLYECSCKELDDLVCFARENGAVGSRLTGAGWGGCIISVVCNDKAYAFEKALSSKSVFTFKTEPSRGAVIYDCSSLPEEMS